MLTKKNFLVVSIVLAVFEVTTYLLGTYLPVQGNDYATINMFADAFWNTISVLPLFVFSVVTYFLRGETFRLWSWFAIFWVPVSTVLAYMTPESHNFVSTGPALTAIVLATTFVLVSLFIIIISSLYYRARDQKGK